MITKKKILILEDDSGVARLQEKRLSQVGYEVVCVSDSEVALGTIRNQKIDLLLLDNRLSRGEDGISFFEKLKSLHLEVPTILITGYSDDTSIIRAFRAGVRDYVTKSLAYLDYLPEVVQRVFLEIDVEDQLAYSQAHLQAIVTSARDAIITLNANREISLFNLAAERMFLCSFESAKALGILKLIPELARWDRQKVGKSVSELVLSPAETLLGNLTNHPQSIPSRYIEVLGIRLDGQTIPLEVSFAEVSLVGQPLEILILRDIRARKKSEQELKDKELFTQNTLNSLSALICVLDQNGTIVAVNRSWKHFAMDSESIWFAFEVEQNFFTKLEGVKPIYQEAISKLRDKIVMMKGERIKERTSSEREQEYFSASKKGIRWFSCQFQRFETNGNVHIVMAHEDITARKNAELNLRETNRQLEIAVNDLREKSNELHSTTQQLWQSAKLASVGELAAGIAHEINNPLGTVSLRIESLLAQTEHNDPRRRMLEIIDQEVERMASLVSNLLQFSRQGNDQVSSVDLREEIIRTIELTEYHMRKKGVTIHLDFAEEIPIIYADRQKLRQVFLNLFTNAADAMPYGGKLTPKIRTKLDPTGKRMVVIEVSDTGHGIAKDHLHKVTDPFFTTKEDGKGTGLGLAICKRIIQDHHGFLEIESEEGQGTTVRLVLPIKNGTNVAHFQEKHKR